MSDISLFKTSEAVERCLDASGFDRDSYGKHCCPFCGSGTKNNGTSALSITDDGHIHCFSCGFSGDLFDLIGRLTGSVEFAIQLAHARQLTGFGITGSGKYPAKPQKKPKKEPIDIYPFVTVAKKHLSDTDYLTRRGISLKTGERFGIGFEKNWIHPSVKKAIPSPRLIIPTSEKGYLAVDTRDTLRSKQREYAKMKVGEAGFFNLEAIYSASRPVFVTEGEIDALSIIEVGGNAVSLGSVTMVNRFVSTLKSKKPSIPLLISLDNDERGKEASVCLVDKLRGIGVVAISVNISETHKDPNEALVADRDSFAKRVEAEAGAYEHLCNSGSADGFGDDDDLGLLFDMPPRDVIRTTEYCLEASPSEFYSFIFGDRLQAESGARDKQYTSTVFCSEGKKTVNFIPVYKDLDGFRNTSFDREHRYTHTLISYAGLRASKDMARELYGFVETVPGLSADMMWDWKTLPSTVRYMDKAYKKPSSLLVEMRARKLLVPNFVVPYKDGLRFYYIFDEPVALFPERVDYIRKAAKLHSRKLAGLLLGHGIDSDFVPDGNDIYESHPVIGSYVDGKLCRAYKTSAEKVSINDFLRLLPVGERFSIHTEKTKEKYQWTVKTDFLDWFYDKCLHNGRVNAGVLKALVAVAVKCSQTEHLAEKNPMYPDGLVKSPLYEKAETMIGNLAYVYGWADTPEQRKAIAKRCLRGTVVNENGEFDEAGEWSPKQLRRVKRETLSKWSGVELKANARNFCSSENHLAKVNNSNRERYSDPAQMPKAMAVIEWRKSNPGKTKAECARALGLSASTVAKWWKARVGKDGKLAGRVARKYSKQQSKAKQQAKQKRTQRLKERLLLGSVKYPRSKISKSCLRSSHLKRLWIRKDEASGYWFRRWQYLDPDTWLPIGESKEQKIPKALLPPWYIRQRLRTDPQQIEALVERI